MIGVLTITSFLIGFVLIAFVLVALVTLRRYKRNMIVDKQMRWQVNETAFARNVCSRLLVHAVEKRDNFQSVGVCLLARRQNAMPKFLKG